MVKISHKIPLDLNINCNCNTMNMHVKRDEKTMSMQKKGIKRH